PEHLRQVWEAVGADWARDEFDSETGLPLLERHFASVERLIRGGSVLWLERDDLQAYLDAYREMLGPLRAPEGPYPFVATRAMRVEFKTDARNLRVRGALLGVGASFEGIFRKHMKLPDSIRDSAWYAVVDDDWPRVRTMLEQKIEKHA